MKTIFYFLVACFFSLSSFADGSSLQNLKACTHNTLMQSKDNKSFYLFEGDALYKVTPSKDSWTSLPSSQFSNQTGICFKGAASKALAQLTDVDKKQCSAKTTTFAKAQPADEDELLTQVIQQLNPAFEIAEQTIARMKKEFSPATFAEKKGLIFTSINQLNEAFEPCDMVKPHGDKALALQLQTRVRLFQLFESLKPSSDPTAPSANTNTAK